MLRNTSLAQRQILKLWESSRACIPAITIVDNASVRSRASSTAAASWTASAPSQLAARHPRSNVATAAIPVNATPVSERPTTEQLVPPVEEFIRVLDSWNRTGRAITRSEVVHQAPEVARYMKHGHLYAQLSRALVTSDKPRYAVDAIQFARQCGRRHRLSVYEILCAYLGKSHHWTLVLRTVELATQHTNTCSPTLLNRKTRALVELREYRRLEEILKEFERFNIKPDRLTYEFLLRGFLRNSDLPAARRCISAMESAGFPMQASTHAIVGSTYRTLGVDQGVEEESLQNLSSMSPGEQLGLLNNLLRGHLDNNNIEKAIHILSIFEPQSVEVAIAVLYGGGTDGDRGTPTHLFARHPDDLSARPLPNASTFAVLIHFCSNQKKFEGTLQLLHSMMSQGIEPSVQVITAMVHACYTNDKPSLAIQLVASTCNPEVTPRSLFDPIYPGSWDEPRFEIHVPGLKANIQLFNSLMKGVLPLYNLDGAMQVLHIMQLNGVIPDERTVELLLSHMDKVEMAHPAILLRLLGILTDRDILPTPKHMRIIFRCLFRYEKHRYLSSGWSSWRYYELAKHNAPSGATQIDEYDPLAGLVMPQRLEYDRLSRPFFDFLERKGYKADYSTFSMRLRFEAVIRQDMAKAQEIFDEMVSRGMEPNSFHYCAMIEGYTIVGDWNTARSLLWYARDSGVVLDATPYTILTAACARRRRPQKALRMFKEMIEAGTTPDVPSIHAVIGAFYAVRGTRLAKDMLMTLWEFIEPFPQELTQCTLLELAQHLQDRHGKRRNKPTQLPVRDRLATVERLKELTGVWKKTIPKDVQRLPPRHDKRKSQQSNSGDHAEPPPES